MSPWNVDRNSDKLALVRRTSGPLNSMNRYLASGTKLAIQCLPNTVALLLICDGARDLRPANRDWELYVRLVLTPIISSVSGVSLAPGAE